MHPAPAPRLCSSLRRPTGDTVLLWLRGRHGHEPSVPGTPIRMRRASGVDEREAFELGRDGERGQQGLSG